MDNLARDKQRRAFPRRQHSPNQDIHKRGNALDIPPCGDQSGGRRETVSDALEGRDIPIQHDHVRAKPEKSLRGIGPNHAATQDRNLGRRDARHAAQQDTLAAPIILQTARRDGGGHCAAHLAERPQDRS